MTASIAAALPSWVPSGWAVLDNPATKWTILILLLVMPLAPEQCPRAVIVDWMR